MVAIFVRGGSTSPIYVRGRIRQLTPLDDLEDTFEDILLAL